LAGKRLGPLPFGGFRIATPDPEQGNQTVLLFIVHAFDLLRDLVTGRIALGLLQRHRYFVVRGIAAKVGNIGGLLRRHGVEPQYKFFDPSTVKGERNHCYLLSSSLYDNMRARRGTDIDHDAVPACRPVVLPLADAWWEQQVMDARMPDAATGLPPYLGGYLDLDQSKGRTRDLLFEG